MSMKRVTKRTIPLCILPSNELVCYKDGYLFIYENGHVSQKILVFNNFKERCLGRIRLLSRLMRLGIRSAVSIGEKRLVLSVGHSLYELDYSDCSLSKGFKTPNNSRPLFFTHVNNVEGFNDGLYFGEYLMNMDKAPVSIYKRAGKDNWEVVYTFPKGTINHIHNIIPDPYRNCLWVFTGDFDEAAAIWKVTDNFRKVERVAYNNQKYRGCVAFALSEGLIYATDTPFAKNYVYLFDTETYNVKELFPMQGSCIYGCKWKDKYVFSSTVEGDGRDESLWDFFFDRKLGAGVVDDYAHLVIGDLKSGFKEIYKEKKDWLSYLFQFGVFKFPAGENNGDTLFFQPMATKKNDLRLMSIMWGDIEKE